MRPTRLGAVRVSGRSMQPTVYDGDFLLVRWGAPARPGDLVVVRLPGGRPIGVKRAVRREAGGWWVERDNPAEGVDSWGIGAIPDEDVLGRVVLRYWPLARRRAR
jgi:phage repressor protein C with HTH and peptisase S24 domain